MFVVNDKPIQLNSIWSYNSFHRIQNSEKSKLSLPVQYFIDLRILRRVFRQIGSSKLGQGNVCYFEMFCLFEDRFFKTLGVIFSDDVNKDSDKELK